MPAGIEAVVENGFATIDFIDQSLKGPALAALAAAGSRVTKETRQGPRARYTMPEGDAIDAGLIDGATVKPTALAHGDTGFAATLQSVGMAGARPEQPTIRNHFSGSTPAADVMAIPGPDTTVGGRIPDPPTVTRPTVEVQEQVHAENIRSEAPKRPPTTTGILIDAPAQLPNSGVQTSFPRSAPDSTWTVAELKSFASDNGIDLGEATKKADILAAIEAAV